MQYAERAAALQSKIVIGTAILLSNPADVRYFTGFVFLNPEEREAFCLITAKSITLLYPSFSPVQKLAHIEYHQGYWASDLESVIKNKISKEEIKELAIDANSLYVAEYKPLENIEALSLSELDRDLIWQIRVKKEAEELADLKSANSITQDVMTTLLSVLKAGLTELDLALECELLFKKSGSLQLAFPPVIAFGENAALPHHQPTDKVLEKEMAVLIDIGAKIDGYCGDMTRTVWFGDTPDPEFKKIEQVVMSAYQAAVTATKAGQDASAVDLAARNVVDKAGYDQQFIHTTGHGVGLEIHEQPSVYFKKKFILPENAVITIEPGVYLERKFGYRYENSVVVTKDGYQELNRTTQT